MSFNRKFLNLTTYNHIMTGIDHINLKISKRGVLKWI